MKILLILPRDRTYRYRGAFKRSVSYAPLTLTSLAALVPPDIEADIRLVDEGVQQPTYDHRRPDLVGITCVTASAGRAYRLARYWRERGAFVALGGAHPTLMPQEAARHADAVVIGPGEISWPHLLRDFRRGTTRPLYRAECPPLLSSPIPRRDLQANRRYLAAPTVIANRGCRNQCHFCVIPPLHGRLVRPIPEVIEEIRSLGARRILLLDPSPTTNRDYACRFFEALIPLGVQWGGLATADVVEDRELFELMIRSGCAGLLIGFESLSQASLNRNGKRFNRVDQYRTLIQRLHDHRLAVLGCFVLGFDDDTPAGLRRLAEMVDQLEIDFPRYAVLTPFPGTPLFDRLQREERILTTDWSLYDTEHVVFQPRHMSAAALQQILEESWRRTFRLGRIWRRVRRAKRRRWLHLIINLGLRHYAARFG